MADVSVRTAHLKDTMDLYKDIENGTLPAVSFVKPSGWVDGHPASSKWNLFEGFVKKIVDEVKANNELWESTAIFVTVDEGGGYYDSGYVQPLDYFGDGTRIPLLVVSPFTKPGHISHSYTDHVSIIKFIEYNWDLPPSAHEAATTFQTRRRKWAIRMFRQTARQLEICLTCSNFRQLTDTPSHATKDRLIRQEKEKGGYAGRSFLVQRKVLEQPKRKRRPFSKCAEPVIECAHFTPR